MSAEQNKALVMRFIEAVWNQGNLDVLDEVAAPTFELRSPYYGVKDVAAYKEFVRTVRTRFPDTYFSTEELLAAEGDAVVQRWTFHGTDTGGPAALSAPPTGKHVTMSGTSVYHLRDGKILDEFMTEDALGLRQQLQG